MSFFNTIRRLFSNAFAGMRIDEQSQLSEQELRLYALGCPYVYQQGGTVNTRSTGVSASLRRNILSSWWGINSRSEAIETLDYLARGSFDQVATYIFKAFSFTSEEQGRQYLIDAIPTADMLNRAFPYLDNLRQSYEGLKRSGVITRESDLVRIGVLGWDAGRLNFVARLSLEQGYITQEECQSAIEHAYKMVCGHFDSWRDYGMSYAIGRALYAGNSDICPLIEELLTNPKSPWTYVSWH